MLKLTKKYEACNECDYHYAKNSISGCVFPNHAPIDAIARSACNSGEYVDIIVDEDFVQIKNIVEVKIL